MKQLSNTQRGFTLIELMIVVAIIGILAAVAIPAYMDYTRKGKTTEATLQLNDIGKHVKSYFLEKEAFPPAAAGLPGVDGKACDATANPTGKFAATPAAFEADLGWKTMGFVVASAAMFTYHFTPSTTVSASATAVGDLDCDGIFTTYDLKLTNSAGALQDVLMAPTPD